MKEKILFFDQDPVACKNFRDNHSESFDIITSHSAPEFVSYIDNFDNEKFSLVLIDVFTKNFDSNSDCFNQDIENAEKALEKLREQRDITNEAVEKAYSKSGFEILKLVRQKDIANNIPLALFSRYGLWLLNESELKLISEHNVKWTGKSHHNPCNVPPELKDEVKNTEFINISHTIETFKNQNISKAIVYQQNLKKDFARFRKTLERRYYYTLLFLWILAALLITIQVYKFSDNDPTITILISAMTLIIGSILPYFFRKEINSRIEAKIKETTPNIM